MGSLVGHIGGPLRQGIGMGVGDGCYCFSGEHDFIINPKH